MSLIEATPSELFHEIIKLQLKKPKNWNWQLSTSKSSPHIALPIIQLYNSKGQLVVEAKDSGVTQRRSWHSLDIRQKEKPTNAKKEYKEPTDRHLQRCRSDTLETDSRKNRCANKLDSIRRRETQKSTNNKLTKSSSAALERRANENRKSGSYNESSIKGNTLHDLRKSSSDVLELKGNPRFGETCARKPLFGENKEKRDFIPGHRRSRSDDLFRRKLKTNEESLKRAELDGYKNFITPNVLLPNNASNIEVNHFKQNRYKTRTSSAGTLIISEESFNNRQRRRRRRDASIENSNNAQNNAGPYGDTMPNTERTTNLPENRYASEKIHKGSTRLSENGESGGLFYSRSDVFPLKLNKKCDDNCNYLVTTPDSDNKNNKSFQAIMEKLERKKRRKVRRHYSDASTSPTALEKKYQHKRKGNGTKARVSKEHPKDAVDGSGDSDLLQLVRRLSSSDHVKMGANVSRHSSKGLSGRRSQSSGSICNGKGRHNDGKMCGSLPSYLDDRNSNGCNNNHHDCEKPPLDEVQRIPPLGDGAPLHWKFSDNQTVLCDQGYGSERSPEEEYPPPLPDHDTQCHHHLEPHACYPFITPESTFIVKLTKSSRGLGLSVTGGIDSGGSWPGLIRIKRLFPHQPASACGLLNVGDLIIEANGITLTGLTNYEALEVLRTAPNQVDLKVCRPPPDVLSCVSPISEVPPPPPRREPPTSLNLHPSEVYCTPEDDYYHGEFEVTLTKIQGSLGFTLRKEDDSALGHYVRALVREPALTDGRIRAGDKIIAVNEVEISPMSHEQAVQFLRQCGDVVKLRLYRDSAQTPVAALSPTETTPRTSFSKKTHLRQEAVDMLNDIAVRKLIPANHATYKCSTSPTASPRRLRRQACPSDASQMTDTSIKYLINDEQFHEGLLQKCPYDDDSLNLFTIDPDDGDRPSRPSSLDLYNPNQTPVAARKPRFNFSLAHNAYELNNLDADVLDAPNLTYNLGNEDVKSTEVECGDSFPKEPASMPHIPCDNQGFSYKNPVYQSAHPPCGTELEEKAASGQKTSKTDDTNMKKWKGIVFDGHDEREEIPSMPIREEYEILAIELNRGWNSRLGFSLQGAAGVTYVSAVHADSVAARDGRLKPGDRVIKVNDESVEHLSTTEIIDLLRIVRGPVCIVVSRIKSKEDCPKSNAEN
ncbi:uncharacterized protein LOC660401 isoform X2 [Tribolium castaneum]|nr:PREDICTED: uncharacterized protein LOC660401 isoform X2 [Tribolium castaneum]|eukprot:XP_015840769.1 PREDICTED: uncharacterized protein LOC660401 isoform X2 [Tribolium castaneum]